MTKKKILIVEDEVKLAELLADYLQKEGYQTHMLHDGSEVIEYVKNNQPDLILLDVMLPNKDGLSLCREIRQLSTIPIFILTARVDEIDRLLGLEIGADDYICKPYSPREVIARVRALFRRLETSNLSEGKEIAAQYYIDGQRQHIKVGDEICPLTVIEYQLLSTMAKEPGRIYSREELMLSMYKDNRVVSDRTIDSHIKKLRKKLVEKIPGYEFINSVYGVGYRFEMINKFGADPVN